MDKTLVQSNDGKRQRVRLRSTRSTRVWGVGIVDTEDETPWDLAGKFFNSLISWGRGWCKR